MEGIVLAEVKIHGLNEKWCRNGAAHGADPDTDLDAIGLMRKAYVDLLYHDGQWHFFWEGQYTVVRCDPYYAKTLKQIFEQADESFEVTISELGYQENVEMTKKYLNAFVPIFHGYSILALAIADEDFIEILERINHCFLNMVTRFSIRDQFRIVGDPAETHCGMGWEGLAIQAVAHMRSYTAGWYNRK